MPSRCLHVHATTFRLNTNATHSAAKHNWCDRWSVSTQTDFWSILKLLVNSSYHFIPAHDLQWASTLAMRDPSRHLSDPGTLSQFLYNASNFQLQQQLSSTLSNLQPSAAATTSPNICDQPLSYRQPAGTNPHNGFGAPLCVSASCTGGILVTPLIGTDWQDFTRQKVLWLWLGIFWKVSTRRETCKEWTCWW